jgi:hypothetical protein
MEVSGQLHVPAALPPKYNLDRKLSWFSRACPNALELRKMCFYSRESNPGRAARIPTLYRMSYSGSFIFHTIKQYLKHSINNRLKLFTFYRWTAKINLRQLHI